MVLCGYCKTDPAQGGLDAASILTSLLRPLPPSQLSPMAAYAWEGLHVTVAGPLRIRTPFHVCAAIDLCGGNPLYFYYKPCLPNVKPKDGIQPMFMLHSGKGGRHRHGGKQPGPP